MTTTVEHVLDAVDFGGYQWRVLLLCSAGYFAVCSELLLVVFLEAPLRSKFALTEAEYAWFPFIVSLCSLAASMCAGKLADLYGRRPVFTGSLLLVGGAGLLCSLCTSFPALVVMRSLVGVGTGALAVVDYVVFREFAPTRTRGRYLYAMFAAGCLGVLYLAAVAAFGKAGWRCLVVLAALPTLPAGCLRFVQSDETPHYLASRGRYADAYVVLERIGSVNGNPGRLPQEQELLRAMAAEGERGAACDRGALASVLRLCSGRVTAPLAAIWLLQSTAYWGLTLFLPEFLVAAGVPANRTIFAMVACELPGCCVAALLVDHPRVGRVGTLRINLAAASAAALTLSPLARPPELVILLSCAVYFFMIPVWAVLFLYTPESYPTESRGTAMGMFQTLQGVPGLFSPFLSAKLVTMDQAYMAAWGGCLLLALLSTVALPSRQPSPPPRSIPLTQPGH